jgi:hypothetical protein
MSSSLTCISDDKSIYAWDSGGALFVTATVDLQQLKVQTPISMTQRLAFLFLFLDGTTVVHSRPVVKDL